MPLQLHTNIYEYINKRRNITLDKIYKLHFKVIFFYVFTIISLLFHSFSFQIQESSSTLRSHRYSP